MLLHHGISELPELFWFDPVQLVIIEALAEGVREKALTHLTIEEVTERLLLCVHERSLARLLFLLGALVLVDHMDPATCGHALVSPEEPKCHSGIDDRGVSALLDAYVELLLAHGFQRTGLIRRVVRLSVEVAAVEQLQYHQVLLDAVPDEEGGSFVSLSVLLADVDHMLHHQ